MNYNKYKSILEFIPKLVDRENIKREQLYDIIKKVIITKNILISLSGGVDSMVLTILMNILKNELGIKLYCCHINYNNRPESIQETEFLVEWCAFENISLDVKNITHIKRGDINRNTYEEETKSIRYNYYYELIQTYKCSGIFLAHHQDDLSENVFNNIMRGRKDITDLSVFKKEKIISGVRVYRPMLEIRKNIIYDISKKYEIPYFLDTTPDWSCRGKMRRQIFPKCDDCYSDSFMNSLVKLSKESDELGNILNNYIINPIINSVKVGDYGFIIPKNEILQENLILKIVIKKICIKLKIINLKQKSLINLSENYHNNITINVINGYFTFIEPNYIIFIKDNLPKEINIKYLSTYDDNISSFNELINGIICFIWKKNKYIPNYQYNCLKKNIGNLNIEYIGTYLQYKPLGVSVR